MERRSRNMLIVIIIIIIIIISCFNNDDIAGTFSLSTKEGGEETRVPRENPLQEAQENDTQ